MVHIIEHKHINRKTEFLFISTHYIDSECKIEAERCQFKVKTFKKGTSFTHSDETRKYFPKSQTENIFILLFEKNVFYVITMADQEKALSLPSSGALHVAG